MQRRRSGTLVGVLVVGVMMSLPVAGLLSPGSSSPAAPEGPATSPLPSTTPVAGVGTGATTPPAAVSGGAPLSGNDPLFVTQTNGTCNTGGNHRPTPCLGSTWFTMSVSLSSWENLLVVEVEPYFYPSEPGPNSALSISISGPSVSGPIELPANLWNKHTSAGLDQWYQDVWYATVGAGTYVVTVGGTTAGSASGLLFAFQDAAYCASSFHNGNSSQASAATSCSSAGSIALGIISSYNNESYTSTLGNNSTLGTAYSNGPNSASFGEWEDAPAAGVSYALGATLSPGSATTPPWGEVALSVEACNYTITFNESGLPGGSEWDVGLAGMGVSSELSSHGSLITFTVPCGCNGTNMTNDTYNFTVSSPPCYQATPASGSVTISPGLPAGSEVTRTITFSPCQCNNTITFDEAGLPIGTAWDINLTGPTSSQGLTSNGSSITFTVPCDCNGTSLTNDTYNFTVSSPPCYQATPASGTVEVPYGLPAGDEVNVSVNFTACPCNYTATFNESGLPAGTAWDVSLDESGTWVTLNSTSNSITFDGLCGCNETGGSNGTYGTYSYIVSSPAGYSATPAFGNVTVSGPSGNESYVKVRFTTTPPCCTSAGNPTVGDRPAGEVLDPATNQVYVANWGLRGGAAGGTVSVLSANAPFSSPAQSPITVGGGPGSYPRGEAYDPATDTVWVTLWGVGAVAEICAAPSGCGVSPHYAQYTVAENLSLGRTTGPYAIAYDFEQGDMVVADSGYGCQPTSCADVVTVIAAGTLTASPSMVTVTLHAGSSFSTGPVSVVYDWKDNRVFVADPAVAGVDALSPTWAVTTTLLPAESQPSGLAYDSGTGQIFVADQGTGAADQGVSVFSASSPPASAGIPIVAGTRPVGVTYDVLCAEILVSNFGSSTVSIISDSTDQVVATVVVGEGPDALMYDMGATYQGVPGSVWVANYGHNAGANGAGNVTVLVCAFCANATPLTTVLFTPIGLPAGSAWAVALSSYSESGSASAPASISFEVPAGALWYDIPDVGSYYAYKVTGVAGATVTSASIPSTPTVLDVYFEDSSLTCQETGLPAGTPWDCEIHGKTVSETVDGSGSSLTVAVPNGTYKYVISKPCEYEATPLQGSVVVRGPAVVNVVFTLLTKLVEFRESGLHPGTTWTVNVTGPGLAPPFASTTRTVSGTSATLSIETVCGNYSWNTGDVHVGGATFRPTPASGTFEIKMTANQNGVVKDPTANPISIRFTDPRPTPESPEALAAAGPLLADPDPD